MRVWHHSLQMIKPVAKNRSYRWWFGFNFLYKRYEILTPENQNSAPVNIKTKLLFGFVGFFSSRIYKSQCKYLKDVMVKYYLHS